jgi:hypothetical protein
MVVSLVVIYLGEVDALLLVDLTELVLEVVDDTLLLLLLLVVEEEEDSLEEEEDVEE